MLVELELKSVEKIIEKIKSDPEPEYIKQIELDTWKLLYENLIGKGQPKGQPSRNPKGRPPAKEMKEIFEEYEIDGEIFDATYTHKSFYGLVDS